MSNDKTKSLPLDVDQAFRDHAGWLLRQLTRRVGASQQVVEDACSFVWEQAWIHRAKLSADPPHRLRGWLALVGERQAWRMTQREDLISGVEDVAETLAATVTGPDEIDALFDRIEVEEVLDASTNERQRKVMLLRAAGFSYNEIATALDMSYTAVNKAITKVKDKAAKRYDR